MVQESDNTVDLGNMMYTGLYTDAPRVITLIKDAWKRVHPTAEPLMIGGRAKNHKEIKYDGRFSITVPNQPIHMEVDKAQASRAKRLLVLLFNKAKERQQRPGYLVTRYIPAVGLAGNSAKESRVNNLYKHKAAVSSLTLLVSHDIKGLDKAIKSNGTTTSLRAIIMEMPFPLADEHPETAEEDNKSYLFHSVDIATTGRDADGNAVHCTAPNDRSTKTDAFLEVLPAYICRLYGRKICEAIFHPTILGDIDDVVFHHDEAGNWNGKWTTAEEQQNQEILNEPMGFNIDLSFLQQAEGHAANNGPVHLIADNASVASFGSNTGRPNGPPNNDGRTSASVSFSADNVEAAADTIGGGSTA